jgi:hypothetical protein
MKAVAIKRSGPPELVGVAERLVRNPQKDNCWRT